MEKPKLSTPWTVEEPNTMYEGSLYSIHAGSPREPQWICEMNGIGKIWTDSAKAIVTAVNCTYGANINPEKVKDAVRLLEWSLEALKIMTSGGGLYKELKDDIEQSLIDIKYKD